MEKKDIEKASLQEITRRCLRDVVHQPDAAAPDDAHIDPSPAVARSLTV